MCYIYRDAYFRRKVEERKKDKEQKKSEEVVASKVQQKGAVLHFKGLTKTDTSREDIKVRKYRRGVVLEIVR